MAAGSTTTTPSSSRPFTTLTGTTVTAVVRPLRVARPCSMPSSVSAAETSSAMASGVTTAMLPSPSEAAIFDVVVATSA